MFFRKIKNQEKRIIALEEEYQVLRPKVVYLESDVLRLEDTIKYLKQNASSLETLVTDLRYDISSENATVITRIEEIIEEMQSLQIYSLYLRAFKNNDTGRIKKIS